MVQTVTADGGIEREPIRHTDDISLEDVQEDDRIAPALIPRSPELEVGDQISSHLARRDDGDDDRTFSVRLIAGGEDSWGDVQTALVYDPDTDQFARLSGHTSSGAMNQKERDWKVRDVGTDVVVDDAWDIDLQEYEDDYDDPQVFVEEWVEILVDEIRHDGDYDGLVEFDGKTFTLRDWDSRTAKVQYHLED